MRLNDAADPPSCWGKNARLRMSTVN
jgi:hypothetical protein